MRQYLLFLFTLTSIVSAGDIGGSWSKQQIIDCTWGFITSQREEMLVRSKAVLDEINVDLNLQFSFHKNLSKEQQEFQGKFLSAKLSKQKTENHLRRLLTELEKNRAVLSAAEIKAEKSWNKSKKVPEKQEMAETEEYLYGTKINSKKLGVILDNSGSMNNYLPNLRQEITNKFQGSEILEVYGSLIEGYIGNGTKEAKHWFYMSPIEGENPFSKKWYCQYIRPINIHYSIVGWERDIVTAMETLAYHKKVDAIYWFTDLKDRVGGIRGSNGIKELEKMQKETGVKIYLQTLGKLPTGKLKSLIKKSGGAISKKLK